MKAAPESAKVLITVPAQKCRNVEVENCVRSTAFNEGVGVGAAPAIRLASQFPRRGSRTVSFNSGARRKPGRHRDSTFVSAAIGKMRTRVSRRLALNYDA